MTVLDILRTRLDSYKTSNYVIHSDLMIFGRDISRLKGKAVETLAKKLNPQSLAIPTFNLNTNSSDVIDLSILDLSMGSLPREAMLALKNKNGLRLPNPIHSYTFFPLNSKLKKIDCAKSFGVGSVFDYFSKENYCWISLGADIDSGFTIFHHLECLSGVPYRKHISFERTLIVDNQKSVVKFKYFARANDNYKQNFKRAVQFLIEAEVVTVDYVGDKAIYTGLVKNIEAALIPKLQENPFYLVTDKDDR
tara:strand:- start:717 stop:1466 length:750 start_codon:yes stop_codon:yes gene_type:complete